MEFPLDQEVSLRQERSTINSPLSHACELVFGQAPPHPEREYKRGENKASSLQRDSLVISQFELQLGLFPLARAMCLA